MKYVVVFLLLLLSALCSLDSCSSSGNSKQLGDVCLENQLGSDNKGAHLTFWKPNPVRPEGYFRLDSNIVEDSLHFGAYYFIRLDTSTKVQPSVCKANLRHMNQDMFQREEEEWPISFAKTGDLVSQVIINESFVQDDVHFNFELNTLNVDLKKQQSINLKDVFLVENDQQKQAFCDSINNSFGNSESSPEPIGIDWISWNDFYIGCGMLTVFPRYYPILGQDDEGPSVSLSRVASFIRPEYKWLLD